MSKVPENNPKFAKVKQLALMYYIAEPIILAVGIALALTLKNGIYILAVLALAVCYAAFGYQAGNIIDEQIKMVYPQFYSLKNRPKNRDIKRQAKIDGRKDIYSVKTHQTVMIVVCMVCILTLCLVAASVIG